MASTGTTYGIYGQTSSPSGTGVLGVGGFYGVWGQSSVDNGIAVRGEHTATSGSAYGVFGSTASPSGYGVYSSGNARVFGNLSVSGSLTKGIGTFQIDHPLDPANKYLSHSFVESPDMMNIYNGNVALDEQGEAWVELPDWFEALNRDFRYQLTAIGAPGPNLHIAQKVRNHRFQMAGGTPGMEVSWQVTGVRQDPYAQAHRIKVEQDKPEKERGLYLHPEVYGQPKEKGIEYARRNRLLGENEQAKAVTVAERGNR